MKNFIKIIGKLIVSIFVILFMVISTAALGIYYIRATDSETVDNPENLGIFTKEEIKEKINVLVVGTNQNLTDFIMVVGYDPQTGNISLLSIPRDTKYTGLNGKDTAFSKINAIYQGKHIDKLQDTIEKMLNIKIDKYLIFDKNALWDVVDQLGGVTVDVGKNRLKYSDPVQNLYIDLKPGVQVLDGKKAEQYVRFRRYVDGDLGRIKAQQNFIKAFLNECIKPSKIGKLPGIAKNVISEVKTDISIDLILYYLEDVVKIDLGKLRVETLPGYAKNMSGVSFYIYKEKEAKQLANEMYNGVIDTTNEEDNQKDTSVNN